MFTAYLGTVFNSSFYPHGRERATCSRPIYYPHGRERATFEAVVCLLFIIIRERGKYVNMADKIYET